MKRKHLYQSEHPFDDHPFEASQSGSWEGVEFIEVRDGVMTLNFTDNTQLTAKNGPYANIRIKSRKATLSDCICFLRPGIDVCVLSSPNDGENSGKENPEPLWIDAKISSIERKPHESQCSCQFFVKLYVHQGPLGSERAKLSRDTKLIGIDQISILQRLENYPCEGLSNRWNSSEDCPLVQRTKLFSGKFLSDLTWLLAASVLKQIAFVVRSVQNKIVYQISECKDDHSLVKAVKCQNFLNFKLENDILTPTVIQFVRADTTVASSMSVIDGAESLPLGMNLRRSKRRNVQPDRFLGCDILPETNVGWVRTLPYTPNKWKDDELHIPLSYLFGARTGGSEEHTVNKAVVHSPKLETFEHLAVSAFKSRLKKLESGVAKIQGHESQLAIVPIPTKRNPETLEQFDTPVKTSVNMTRGTNQVSFLYTSTKSSTAARRKNNFELEDMVFESEVAGSASFTNVGSAKYRSLHPKTDDPCKLRTWKKKTLSAGLYNKLIRSYMKNMYSTIRSQEEPPIIDQWEQFKAKDQMYQEEKMKPSTIEDEGESSETEMLWREMEMSLASVYLLEENEARISTQTMQNSGKYCKHEFKVDEEIGILCHICGFVKSEIKYVSAPFVEFTDWMMENKPCIEEDIVLTQEEEGGLNLFSNQVFCNDMPSSEENENVWALVPDLRKKLHLHQKKAFEFLWRNIAGSLIPTHMKKASKKIGGCVISHTPGAGKTFLIIAFLASYLKLFPAKRPLILAPKTTLYTWYKEFKKWQIPIPVHLIHGRRSYRLFRQNSVTYRYTGLQPTQDVMHILDCLEKLQKWHAQPSVLVMGYTSFLTLMREDSDFEHRKCMAKVLRESPGILVLDEGHNPRSTKSRLRKVLMKVPTDLRIVLSGTLFQNNFCEYFNTLCLARPKFIIEVLRKLDPKFSRRKKGKGKAPHLMESRARKFFLDNIAKKIDSNISEERLQGLNMLKNITNRFIDVYEGGASDGLPGLQIYTILMNSTDIQNEILVKLHRLMAKCPGYPLELELLITLSSIHPWLVKTSNCVNKFFTQDTLIAMEKLKLSFRKGSKVMFVLHLVNRVVRNEKVLIFCHNIAPINLFIDLFERIFNWQKGREILVLTGDLELLERGRVIDKFEESGGPSKVLLASITACAEGISLTAASRVILLDSEWNPSKTKQAIARAFRPGQQKMVYVYQLLAAGTLEEDKYRRTTWKEWVSSMIFSEAFVEDPSRWQAEKIEDDVLREMVEEDRVKSFHMIMKNEKASTS
ncbi:hypothetical protein K2173_002967 [Erythroxylum novogranatense]|uniref:Uncharacterized protein n=1 Tax=Erythroxylum novogranatense TaxID=1862640 RepID=A0AAV8TR75_9ROSI|nr:hypothetical protein K2173_002967 [Erythroxylum novogranatense]